MNWIGVKGEFWLCTPPLLLYPLLHLKAEYLFTTVIVDSPKISTTIGVGVPVAKTNERYIDTVFGSYTRIYSYILQFYTHNGSNHRPKSPALYEIYITYNFVLYNCIVCTPSVYIIFVVSAGLCTDIADFRTSR